MRSRNGRRRAAVLGSVVIFALTAVACSMGQGSPPGVAEPKPAQPSPQVAAQPPAPSPIASPATVAPASSSSPAVSPVVSPSPSPAANAGPPWQHGVTLSLEGQTSSGMMKTKPGATIKLQLKPRPTMFREIARGDTRSIQTVPWERPEIAEMRFCMAARELVAVTSSSGAPPPTCQLPETWVPYATSKEVPFEVDWIGPGEVTARAQFRRGGREHRAEHLVALSAGRGRERLVPRRERAGPERIDR